MREKKKKTDKKCLISDNGSKNNSTKRLGLEGKYKKQSGPFKAQEGQELTPESHVSSNVSSQSNVVYSDYLRKTGLSSSLLPFIFL